MSLTNVVGWEIGLRNVEKVLSHPDIDVAKLKKFVLCYSASRHSSHLPGVRNEKSKAKQKSKVKS